MSRKVSKQQQASEKDVALGDRFSSSSAGHVKETAEHRRKINAARQHHMDTFIDKLRKIQERQHQEALKRNDVKLVAQIEKNKIKKGKHHHSGFLPRWL